MRITEKYTFFLATKEPFSNWHPAHFVVDSLEFNCSEQYMMWGKAMLFGDTEIAQQILSTHDPRTQKELGRKIRNFDPVVWDSHAEEIVYKGCREKFRQNPPLMDALLATGSTILVEAADYDKIWGVGMKETDPGIENEANWKGVSGQNNKLGRILTRIREEYKLELQSETTRKNKP